MKIDLHVHTRYSSCSNLVIEAVLKQAKFVGLDGVAITDHNTMEGYRKIKKINKELLIIPGIEVKAKSGDVIGLFVQEEIPKGLPIEETADRIKEQGGLVIVPHPFDTTRYGVGKDMDLIKPDAVEIFNSRVMFQHHNKKAVKYAKEHNIVGVAGSDAHFLEEIGNAGIITKGDDIFRCIKKGNLKIFGKPAGPSVRLKTKLHRFERKMDKVRASLKNLNRPQIKK